MSRGVLPNTLDAMLVNTVRYNEAQTDRVLNDNQTKLRICARSKIIRKPRSLHPSFDRVVQGIENIGLREEGQPVRCLVDVRPVDSSRECFERFISDIEM